MASVSAVFVVIEAYKLYFTGELGKVCLFVSA